MSRQQVRQRAANAKNVTPTPMPTARQHPRQRAANPPTPRRAIPPYPPERHRLAALVLRHAGPLLTQIRKQAARQRHTLGYHLNEERK